MKITTTKDKIVAVVGLISILYILNPGFGMFEFIPDALPLIGNVDEGLATAVLIACLQYFGYNIPNILKRK